MSSRRQRKIAELLHEEISQLIQYQAHDPRLGFVTVTGVDISPDLQQARVYVTVLGDKADIAETMAGLTSATGYFRHKLGQSLSLRRVPALTFKLDESLAYGMRIDNLLDTISKDAVENTSNPEPDD